jgi:hypothetical protein
MRTLENMIVTPPPLKYDLSDYDTWQGLGFDNDKKALCA